MTVLYEIAKGHKGVSEISGAAHNPKILKYFKDSGHGWVQDDETPWCAAFVNSVIAQAGLQGTGQLSARSFLHWGEKVAIEDAQKGDVVVLWRINKDGPYGHVGFFDSISNGQVFLLGGNQQNKVGINAYDLDRVLDIRCSVLPRKKPIQSTTLQAGAAQIAGSIGTGAAAIGALDGHAQLVALGLSALVVLTAMWIMKERLQSWARGNR